MWEFCVCSLFCYTVLSINSSFSLIPLGKRELIAFLIVFLLSCDCKCSVSLPHGLVGWSAVCNCGIFSTLSFKNCAQHQDCGIFWTLCFASPPTRFYTSHIVNRLDFRLKKDGSYITIKSETVLTNIFYAKNS